MKDAIKNWESVSELGYENSGLVESPGQFGIRGGIIDIFPLTEDLPVRIELWGDEVDSLRSFDTETQRSVEKLEKVQIYPATEMILSRRSFLVISFREYIVLTIQKQKRSLY